eukprot:CAMPEP_0179064640 /NCGR_PEP_ID=MMETSP0796-20121207/28050_1 /TAXON_ID=73915 /ORGANISM="Pyrodinium bahamense, Strain pbaha01" /LENGTH=55 /DNA_ID=CAMNT_0020761589 /DNA_START=187 /DNA_END=354 /DNA_ORIENTATION=+
MADAPAATARRKGATPQAARIAPAAVPLESSPSLGSLEGQWSLELESASEQLHWW